MFIKDNTSRNKDQLYIPMLEMFSDGKARDIYELQADLAEHMDLTTEKLELVYDTGRKVYEELSRLAKTQLMKDGFLKKIEIEGERRAKWQITEKGHIALECRKLYKPLLAPYFK